MKNLSVEKWKEAYLSGIPTYYQRYWLQLLLEMLDPDTDYHYDLGVTDAFSLFEELINTPLTLTISGRKEPVSNARTIFFILSELHHEISIDYGINCLMENNIFLENLKNAIAALHQKSLLLFYPDGKLKEKQDGVMKDWKTEVEAFQKSTLKMLSDDLHNVTVTIPEVYARAIAEKIQSTDSRSDKLEEEIDTLTRGLFFHLVAREQFPPSYLLNTALAQFLQVSRVSFTERFTTFFNKLKRGNKHEYTVYLRLQAKKELRQINQINRALIMESVPGIISLIDQLSQTDKIKRNQIKPIKEFFFKGKKMSV